MDNTDTKLADAPNQAAQTVIEEWFEELGIDISMTDSNRLTTRLVRALASSQPTEAKAETQEPASPVAELANAERHTWASIANGMVGKHRDDSGIEYITLSDAEAAVRAARMGAPVSPIPFEQAEVRRMFLKALDYLRKNKIANFPEGTVEINGAFKRFMDSDTDSAWIGFRIALQAARKLATRTLLPMDSAPLDGTEVVLRVKTRAGCRGKYLVGHHMPGGHCIDDHPPIAPGWYFWNGREFDHAAEPEGWMPLPAEETTTQQEKA